MGMERSWILSRFTFKTGSFLKIRNVGFLILGFSNHYHVDEADQWVRSGHLVLFSQGSISVWRAWSTLKGIKIFKELTLNRLLFLLSLLTLREKRLICEIKSIVIW